MKRTCHDETWQVLSFSVPEQRRSCLAGHHHGRSRIQSQNPLLQIIFKISVTLVNLAGISLWETRMSDIASDSEKTEGLLERIGQGDRQALDQLLDHVRPLLCSFISLRFDRRLRSRLDASDVVQETQLRIARRIGDYLEQRPMPFDLWVRKLAYERLLDSRRGHCASACRSVQREEAWPERSSFLLAQRIIHSGSTPSRDLQRRELTRRVSQLVGMLPDADREVLFLRVYESLSYDEIAGILGIESAAARKRHGRALLKLHALLTEHGLTDLLS
jgi:RNA polymerase sigma-70 factor (ECF subfamily)